MVGSSVTAQKWKCQGKCKDDYNPGNLEHPYVVILNDNVTYTEVDLCELWSPLDLFDAK